MRPLSNPGVPRGAPYPLPVCPKVRVIQPRRGQMRALINWCWHLRPLSSTSVPPQVRFIQPECAQMRPLSSPGMPSCARYPARVPSSARYPA